MVLTLTQNHLQFRTPLNEKTLTTTVHVFERLVHNHNDINVFRGCSNFDTLLWCPLRHAPVRYFLPAQVGFVTDPRHLPQWQTFTLMIHLPRKTSMSVFELNLLRVRPGIMTIPVGRQYHFEPK